MSPARGLCPSDPPTGAPLPPPRREGGARSPRRRSGCWLPLSSLPARVRSRSRCLPVRRRGGGCTACLPSSGAASLRWSLSATCSARSLASSSRCRLRTRRRWTHPTRQEASGRPPPPPRTPSRCRRTRSSEATLAGRATHARLARSGEGLPAFSSAPSAPSPSSSPSSSRTCTTQARLACWSGGSYAASCEPASLSLRDSPASRWSTRSLPPASPSPPSTSSPRLSLRA
mmetsp:Transcript_34563/g.111019  ORF Transcript_34563/g.111019 Transcript_34563/m.111019 type:complete len:230 (+) Transcript_34563:724-1413(+)